MHSLARQIAHAACQSRPLGSREFSAARPLWWGSPSDAQSSESATDATQRLARVESVLFLAREAMSLQRIAQLANLTDATEARTLVSQLAQRYARRGRAFRIENIAGGLRLLTQAQFAPWIGKIGEFCDSPPSELKLSPPALDTLTVVAYRQPVLRAEVEAIRGVACGELLRQLIERDLLRIVGRSEELGRPLEYGTTKRFLQLFGLKSLKDLPPIEAQNQPDPQVAPEHNRLQNVVPRAA
ncbi:SMC-Scp complex subunit ScpB [Aeoliella mucimassa]|uniref:Segregation and condensation protein B n=1 Tax=Aeoliella mucimassa TaxID=2527972 RepID=A0A518AWU2_9BACT|nr:SMC-Scp complex subunit ScpB [Aeoliella mucimassa]QDU59171.1 hypothetical protein Pan181_54120 [Aeoliella mucimassa]